MSTGRETDPSANEHSVRIISGFVALGGADLSPIWVQKRHMPAEVTKDQFHWEGETLVHVPSGARFNEAAGVVDWGNVKAQPDDGDFDPVHVAYVAGQLLAGTNRLGGA